MSNAESAEKQPIVFCHCAYTRILPTKVKNQVLDGLKQAGHDVEEVEDLCRLSAQKDSRLQSLADRQPAKIAACFPRAVKWLFHAGGAQLDEQNAVIGNMREQTAPEVIQELTGAQVEEDAEIEATPSAKPDEPWKPWFPVIDFDRCTNCMQCLSFCLFDVYGVSDDKKIQVQNPTKCKTDCPACSRVCPEAAIMFPKYRSGPINGAEVTEEDLEREKMKVDVSALLGGDIYSMLRQRSERAKSRFSKERDEDRALKERKRCLKKLQEGLDIPTEVLNALPSDDAIRAKASAMAQNSEI